MCDDPNCTNKRGNLPLAKDSFLIKRDVTKELEERMIYILTNIFKSFKDREEKSNCGMDGLKKNIRDDPENMDNRMSKKVQDIRESHKFHYKSYRKQERLSISLRINSS